MRYVVVPPVSGGFAWWVIADTQSPIMSNFEVASFSIHMPDAERTARLLAGWLNSMY